MSHDDDEILTPESVRKDLEELQRRYGNRVQFNVIRAGVFEPGLGDRPSQKKEKTREKVFEFNLRPKDVKEQLDRFVIRQDDAKKALAIAICDHYNHVKACEEHPELLERDYTKQNIILMGPTGVGKTYLVRTLARMIGVPFVRADATKFSETGYVGGNVEELVRDLVTQADGDIGLASYGIIYLDEVDKIAGSSSDYGRDVSGRGVQTGLLKLLEETEIDTRSPYDLQSHMRAAIEASRGEKPEAHTINTRHILFIVSGAFNGLSEIIQKRLHKSALGFDATLRVRDESMDYLRQVTSEDFIRFGFEPEFIGRLPVHVACHPLDDEDLFSILKYSEGSIIRQYEDAFAAYGIKVWFTDEGLQAIAAIAHRERTGARGLVTVCERTFREFKFELSSKNVSGIVVDRELVEHPDRVLEKLMANPDLHRLPIARLQLKEFEAALRKRWDLPFKFTAAGADFVDKTAVARESTPEAVWSERFDGLEAGLELLAQHNTRAVIHIKPEVFEDPAGALDRWIQQSCRSKKKSKRERKKKEDV